MLWSSHVGLDIQFDLWRDKACLQDLLEGNLPLVIDEIQSEVAGFFLETTAEDHR